MDKLNPIDYAYNEGVRAAIFALETHRVNINNSECIDEMQAVVLKLKLLIIKNKANGKQKGD